MPTPSTLTKPETRLDADWLVSEGQETQNEFLNSLSDGELLALPYLFEFWAMDHQLPPEGDWRAWVIMPSASFQESPSAARSAVWR